MDKKQPEQKTKRTRMRGEERRELILLQAKHVFANSNFQEASTSELARASGVTEPVLYKHFSSKKELFLTVLCEFSQRFHERLQERMIQRMQEGGIMEVLEHLVEDYRATVKADPEIDRAFFQASAEAHDPDIAQAMRRHNHQLFERVYPLVVQAQQEGLLTDNLNSESITWGFISFIVFCQYSRGLSSPIDLNHIQPELNRIWLRGLRPSTS